MNGRSNHRLVPGTYCVPCTPRCPGCRCASGRGVRAVVTGGELLYARYLAFPGGNAHTF